MTWLLLLQHSTSYFDVTSDHKCTGCTGTGPVLVLKSVDLITDWIQRGNVFFSGKVKPHIFLIVKVSRLLSRRFPSAWSSHHWSTAQPSSFPEWFVPLCAIRADTQVLPGSTAEHTYGVLMKQLQALDLPTWTSVMSETRKLGTLFFADTGVLWCIGLVDVVQCADSDRDRQ